jgi:hypothetical protein
MNIKKLNNAVNVLKEDLGEALIACDIWPTGTGQSIAGYNPQPKATALFEQVTEYITKRLSGAGFPGLNKYYLIDLEADSMVIVLEFEKHQWGILLNTKKVQLGLLLNVVVPDVRAVFEDALKG